jgi:hypothetical protein
MDLKCEPPSLVLAPQAHELNGRSGTMEEVVAEPASMTGFITKLPFGIQHFSESSLYRLHVLSQPGDKSVLTARNALT